MHAEPLVEIPRSGWPELRDSFLNEYPQCIPEFYALDTQIQNPNLGLTCGVKVFCPYGNVRDGIIMFNNKGSLDEVIVLTTGNHTENLEEALVKTKLKDWSQETCVPFADTKVVRLMRRVCSRTNLQETRTIGTITHILKKCTKPYNLVPPPNTYIGSLRTEHIPNVDKVWQYRYPTSPKLFVLLIGNQLSYGLFSTEDQSLLAWCFISEVGHITHLYCEEPHRGKGYSEYLTKFASNDQLAQGKDVFIYIVESNFAGFQLFRKLDYEVTGRGVWMFFKSDSVINQ